MPARKVPPCLISRCSSTAVDAPDRCKFSSLHGSQPQSARHPQSLRSMAARPCADRRRTCADGGKMPAPSCSPSRAELEGALVDRIQAAARTDGTSSSSSTRRPHPHPVAIRDALAGVQHPLHRGSPLQHPPPRSLPPPQLPERALAVGVICGLAPTATAWRCSTCPLSRTAA